jgi:hypothetical protein
LIARRLVSDRLENLTSRALRLRDLGSLFQSGNGEILEASMYWLIVVRPVSVLRRDALTSQLFRRLALIDLRLRSY